MSRMRKEICEAKSNTINVNFRALLSVGQPHCLMEINRKKKLKCEQQKKLMTGNRKEKYAITRRC